LPGDIVRLGILSECSFAGAVPQRPPANEIRVLPIRAGSFIAISNHPRDAGFDRDPSRWSAKSPEREALRVVLPFRALRAAL
jgi:hypothetical protein